MDTYTLTINFHGICVNFRNEIPDVPHRVVLPNAMGVHFGVVRADSNPQAVPPFYYYVMPHYAFWRVEGQARGQSLSGRQLRVLNPSPGQGLQDPSAGFSLSSFLPATPPYSDSVVLRGHAAAYFDIREGIVSSQTTDSGREFTSISVETDGPPQIAISALPPAAAFSGAGTDIFTIEDGNNPGNRNPVLTIGNIDFDAPDEDSNFDFLLNYLVTRDGIPRVLSVPVPGMQPGGLLPLPLSSEKLATALSGLAIRIASGQVSTVGADFITEEVIANVVLDFVLTASCSNSNWP